MEFTWPLRARVGAAFAVGIILIGLLGWPLGAPADPHGAVCFESIGWSDAAILVLLALASGFIGYFVSWPYGREIGILAVPAGLGVWYDAHLNSVVGQPVAAQIAFGVFVSFLIAGFVVKKTLDSSYIWPCAASAFVSVFVLSLYVDKKVLNYLHQALPPVFFSNAGASVLPVQMVSFGVLGSVAGYWLAVRYSGWRKHA